MMIDDDDDDDDDDYYDDDKDGDDYYDDHYYYIITKLSTIIIRTLLTHSAYATNAGLTPISYLILLIELFSFIFLFVILIFHSFIHFLTLEINTCNQVSRIQITYY